MATQTIPAPNGLAAPKQSVFEHSIFQGIAFAFSSAGTGIVRFLESLAASQQAARHFDRLVHLNDGELAAKGLTREDIPNYVFEQNFGRH